jgi:hypothetical protein
MHMKKPDPKLPAGAPPHVCPVCGEPSYSIGGVHPQCAQHQADAKLTARIKLANKAKKRGLTTNAANGTKPWHKLCPKCKGQVHVRSKMCKCGYLFPTGKRPTAFD